LVDKKANDWYTKLTQLIDEFLFEILNPSLADLGWQIK